MRIIAASDFCLWLNFVILTQPSIYNHDRDMFDGSEMNIFKWMFVIFMVQAAGTTLSEAFQASTNDSVSEYIFDLFNLADMAKTIFIWKFIYCNATGNGSKGHHGLASVLNFLLFFKISTGMNQFKDFRIIFRLVKQTAIDMMAFTGFLILAMILFGTTFYHLNTHSTEEKEDIYNSAGELVLNPDGTPKQQYNNIERRPIETAILYEYLLVFGEFDMDGFENDKYGERWLLFIMATVLLQLVMLNLLIAIMSDTFAKVMSEIEISDGVEMNNLIIEAEKLKVGNRGKVAMHVLHWVEYKT